MGQFIARGMVMWALLAILAPAVVSAASLVIDDFNEVTGVSVELSGFDVRQPTITVDPHNNEKVTISNGQWLANQGATGSGIIYIVEQGTGKLSDILEGTWSSTNPGFRSLATISLTFESDRNGVLASGRKIPKGFPVVEEQSGDLQLTGLFRDPKTGKPVSIPSNLSLALRSGQLVGGSVTGISQGKKNNGTVVCQNMTTKESVQFKLVMGATDWNCGLEVMPGDIIKMQVTIEGPAN